MKTRLKVLSLAPFLVLGACDARDPTSVVIEDRLAFETSISAPELGPGQTMTFSYSLRNISDEDVTISFGGCTLLAYVKALPGEIVYPGGGAWGCFGITVSVTLSPGEATTRTLQITAGELRDFGNGSIRLPAGRYSAYADAYGWIAEDDQRLELRSRDLTFSVRD